jgi:hypothetical protein
MKPVTVKGKTTVQDRVELPATAMEEVNQAVKKSKDGKEKAQKEAEKKKKQGRSRGRARDLDDTYNPRKPASAMAASSSTIMLTGQLKDCLREDLRPHKSVIEEILNEWTRLENLVRILVNIKIRELFEDPSLGNYNIDTILKHYEMKDKEVDIEDDIEDEKGEKDKKDKSKKDKKPVHRTIHQLLLTMTSSKKLKQAEKDLKHTVKLRCSSKMNVQFCSEIEASWKSILSNTFENCLVKLILSDDEFQEKIPCERQQKVSMHDPCYTNMMLITLLLYSLLLTELLHSFSEAKTKSRRPPRARERGKIQRHHSSPSSAKSSSGMKNRDVIVRRQIKKPAIGSPVTAYHCSRTVCRNI